MLAWDENGDHNGASLGKLVDLDRHFIKKYLGHSYEQKSAISIYEVHVDYTSLWRIENFEEIIELAADFLFDQDKRRGWSDGHFSAFFMSKEQGQPDQALLDRQNCFLMNLIEKHSLNGDFIAFLFSAISSFIPVRRRMFIQRFVELNKSFDDFKRISLEPSGWSYSGSLVPVLHERSEFLQSLLPILTSVDLLPHKNHIEQRIGSLRIQIEQEKKTDFLGR